MSEPSELPFFNWIPLAPPAPETPEQQTEQLNDFFRLIDDSLRWLFDNSPSGGLVLDHTLLSNIGVNTHATIDLHLASGLNPHGTTLQQAFAAGNLMASTTAGVGIPAMTEVQRDLLANVQGLVVFNSDSGQLNQNDGVAWSVPGQGLTTMQQAYDNSPLPGAHVVIDNVPNGIVFQASSSGEIFGVHDIADNDIFRVLADPDEVEVNGRLIIRDGFLNAGSQVSLSFEDTFTTGVGFIGGAVQSTGIVTYNSSTFIWALMAENKIFAAAVNPGFAAFTLFNILPTIRNSGNFNLVQALAVNVGIVHERISSGVSTTVQTVGFSFSPQIRTTVLGATMTKTSGNTAVRMSPTYNTVAGSTVNLGPQTGLLCFNPAVALFGSGVGIETMTSYIAVDLQAISFGGNVVKRALRSALTNASNSLMIENTGGARSDFGNGSILFNDLAGLLLGTSEDCTVAFATADFFFMQFNSAGASNGFDDQFRISNPVANVIRIAGILATDELEINMDLQHNGTNLGFYSTAPIAQQLAVPVTIGAVHAALVALGLIT